MGIESIFDLLTSWIGAGAQSDVTKMTMAFLVAARLHRSWVKKDIKEQMGELTSAINNATKTLADGQEKQALRIEELHNRVSILENFKGG